MCATAASRGRWLPFIEHSAARRASRNYPTLLDVRLMRKNMPRKFDKIENGN